MNNSLNKFNNTLQELLETIKNNFPKISENWKYKYPIEGEEYLNNYFSNMSSIGLKIAKRDVGIFETDCELLADINLSEIWKDKDLDEENRENIWKYLHTLYLYAYEYKSKSDIKSILKDLKKLGDKNDIDNEMKTFLEVIDSLANKNIDNEKLDLEKDKLEGMFDMPEILNGDIAKMAKEIMEDLDTEDLKMDNPKELLENLMSGNINKNG